MLPYFFVCTTEDRMRSPYNYNKVGQYMKTIDNMKAEDKAALFKSWDAYCQGLENEKLRNAGILTTEKEA